MIIRKKSDRLSKADTLYKQAFIDIMSDGFNTEEYSFPVRTKWKDGSSAHYTAINGYTFKFNPEDGFPALTTRHVPVRASINEIVFWFFQQRSNKLSDAHDLGINYWDAFNFGDGTIGKSYAYQLKHQRETIKDNNIFYEMDQVSSILWKLKHDPLSRRIMFSYWNLNDDKDKSLKECAFEGQFLVRPTENGNYLDFILRQRSADFCCGVPSNWCGYSALHRVFAYLTGYKLGTFTHYIGSLHIYNHHLISLSNQMNRPTSLEAPDFKITNETTDFQQLKPDDIYLYNYQYISPNYKFEVAL